MVDYKAFVDESGNDPSSSHFVLAGHLSSISLWEQFAEEWDDALGQFGLDEWHTAEAEHNLPAPIVDEIARHLSGIVQRHTMAAMACDASWDDIQALIDDRLRIMRIRPRLAKSSKAPHSLLFLHFCHAVEGRCKALGIALEDVAIVMGKHSQARPRERRAIERIADLIGFRTVYYDTPSNATPLQAADMLAWSYYRVASSHRSTCSSTNTSAGR